MEQHLMKLITLILTSVVLTACGGSSGGGDSEKSLFSLWKEDGTDIPLDLTGGSLGTPYEFFIFEADGAQCDCQLRFLGTEDSGSYVLNNCAYDYGSSANGDPGCESYNHSGTFSKTATTLTVCDDQQDCTEYR
ncbi:hypothetical protein NBRC116585_19610 [Thalassolituus maritimus]|uniref:Lipoprotein n=2 Tax=Thalassolituus maritimus TaxID=484498 RepID=A0ABQ0A0B1_9GAMM